MQGKKSVKLRKYVNVRHLKYLRIQNLHKSNKQIKFLLIIGPVKLLSILINIFFSRKGSNRLSKSK